MNGSGLDAPTVSADPHSNRHIFCTAEDASRPTAQSHRRTNRSFLAPPCRAAVQARLDNNPGAMRTRRETVEHPFGTMKMRMGATHFLMKTLPKVATEMALHVLAYNLTRVLNIFGVKPMMAAVRA